MTMKERIVAALRMLGSGTYKDICTFLQVTKSKQVLRRMKDLVDSGLVVKQFERRQTGAKRTSAVYNLAATIKTDKDMKKSIKKKKIKPKVVHESKFVQPEIFE